MPTSVHDLNLKSKECIRCFFTSFCKSATSPAQTLKPFTQIVRQRFKLKRNDLLPASNHPFQALYVIRSGSLKEYTVGLTGKERINHFYLAGEVLGFEAISPRHYVFSVAALEETVICEVPFAQLNKVIVASFPSHYLQILQQMSQRLNMGLYLTYADAEQRLAGFLLELLGRAASNGTVLELSLPMSRQDIGNHLQLAAETITRLFARLQNNGVLVAAKKTIIINDIEFLRKIAAA